MDRPPHARRAWPGWRRWRWDGCRLSSSVADHRRHLRFGNHLAIHPGDAARLRDLAAHLDDLDLEHDLVTRLHRLSELDVVERHEVNDLRIRLLERAEEQHSSHLRHGLDDEYSGHDRMPGKMPLKERLVDRHVLDADHPLSFFDLENAIDEEKRISVRKHPHDLFDSVHCFSPVLAV